MQGGPAPIPVYRPSYLTDGLEFQGSLVESPANVFYQRVKASRASISAQGSGRFSFQWRSVSDNLLMSPTVMLRFRLSIRCPVVWNQVLQYIAVRGVRAAKGSNNEANTYIANEDARLFPTHIFFDVPGLSPGPVFAVDPAEFTFDVLVDTHRFKCFDGKPLKRR